MNIIGIGIDMVDMARFKGRQYERIAEFILLPEEIESMRQSRDEIQFIASRLAIKEAVIKAYPKPLGYHDMYIEKRGMRPYAIVPSNSDRSYQVEISVAHELQYAFAWAIVSL